MIIWDFRKIRPQSSLSSTAAGLWRCTPSKSRRKDKHSKWQIASGWAHRWALAHCGLPLPKILQWQIENTPSVRQLNIWGCLKMAESSLMLRYFSRKYDDKPSNDPKSLNDVWNGNELMYQFDQMSPPQLCFHLGPLFFLSSNSPDSFIYLQLDQICHGNHLYTVPIWGCSREPPKVGDSWDMAPNTQVEPKRQSHLYLSLRNHKKPPSQVPR